MNTVIRWVLLILFTLLGYELGVWLERTDIMGANQLGPLPLNRLYLAVVGFLIGFLLVPRLAWRIELAWVRSQRYFQKLPPEVPVALTVATGIGLLMAVLTTNLLSQIRGFSAWHSILIALIFILTFSAFALANRDFFRIARPPTTQKLRGGKVLDTSVLIDGRIGEVAELGFLEGPLFVPRQVLRELQLFADSSDTTKRQRGRRGLDALERLKISVGLEVLEPIEVSEDPVDDQILGQARAIGASLVTNDHALGQLARIYGVKTLSVQALSSSLRSPHVAGETLDITIVKEGKEPGQGVGYLEDGTMVVVDGGLAFKGKEITILITQAIQTQVGRLLFGRVASEAEYPTK